MGGGFAADSFFQGFFNSELAKHRWIEVELFYFK